MRAAVRAVSRTLLPREARAAWSSLPPLYHRWAMGPGGERYLLARRGGRALGFAAWRGEELTALFVRPRAQRRGVGRALVRAVALAARREGRRRLRVQAARGAVPFYRSVGFLRLGPSRVPLPGGPALAVERMRMELLAAPARHPVRRAGAQWMGSVEVTSARYRSTTRSRPSRHEASSPR